jgi:hypothetical protein
MKTTVMNTVRLNTIMNNATLRNSVNIDSVNDDSVSLITFYNTRNYSVKCGVSRPRALRTVDSRPPSINAGGGTFSPRWHASVSVAMSRWGAAICAGLQAWTPQKFSERTQPEVPVPPYRKNVVLV